MEVKVVQASIDTVECDAGIVNLFEGVEAPGGATGHIDKVLGGIVSQLIKEGEIRGKLSETTVIHTFGSLPLKKIIVVGLGKREEFTDDRVRQVAAASLQCARKCGARKVATIIHGAGIGGLDAHRAAQCLVEGVILGLYRYERFKTKKEHDPDIEEILLCERDVGKIETIVAGAKRGKIMAEATSYTRDLVNSPGNHMTPQTLADYAQTLVDTYNNLTLTVLERHHMETEGMGALLAVAKGSAEPPKLIVLRYHGAPTGETIALVGKGITFDSGGISLKPSEGMGEMKTDMAGGAAVLGTMAAIAQLTPAVNVIGIIPATENLPSGHAYKPGDIITSMSGKTIEIVTTDAEGRLILADALSYAVKLGADKLVDIATLTGACVIALGKVTAALITNNDAWCRKILAASERSGERMWQLPSFPEYQELIKGDLADLKNSGGRPAGTITGGLFVGEFAGSVPWVHIDIAGTATADKNNGYLVKGATGFGVRTLVELLTEMSR